MRRIKDWWIQAAWWASGIFATGAVWYFLGKEEYKFASIAALAAVGFAFLAIALHSKKDALLAMYSNAPQPVQAPQSPIEQGKVVTTAWWDASDLKKEYESRGLASFRWSNVDRVPEREQQGYEVVYLDDAPANARYRIVNKSGQVLIANRDA